jgi:hypothetical protein
VNDALFLDHRTCGSRSSCRLASLNSNAGYPVQGAVEEELIRPAAPPLPQHHQSFRRGGTDRLGRPFLKYGICRRSVGFHLGKV